MTFAAGLDTDFLTADCLEACADLTFTAADFTAADLGTDLTFTAADFTAADLGTDFLATDFLEACTGLTFTAADFTAADLGTDFLATDFLEACTGLTFTAADFTAADLGTDFFADADLGTDFLATDFLEAWADFFAADGLGTDFTDDGLGTDFTDDGLGTDFFATGLEARADLAFAAATFFLEACTGFFATAFFTASLGTDSADLEARTGLTFAADLAFAVATFLEACTGFFAADFTDADLGTAFFADAARLGVDFTAAINTSPMNARRTIRKPRSQMTSRRYPALRRTDTSRPLKAGQARRQCLRTKYLESDNPLADDTAGTYPRVPTRADFVEIERRVQQRWAEEHTFEKSVEQRSSDHEYVFYDGPPFANGLPHHGHLLTGYVKDVIPRYKTMRGQRVNRRFGWDCHGLPAEMETEQELDVRGHAAIQEYGIERFNAQCRESVLRYTEEWRTTVTRQGRWVDFDNDYKTMNLPYMESVMWAFRQLWEKGLIYQAFRVMPYSWGAETPLSNFEIRLDDATRPRQDPALTVWFEVEAATGDDNDDNLGPLRLLAWTTTPWTLPSNLALAVGPDIEYVVLEAAPSNPTAADTTGSTDNPVTTDTTDTPVTADTIGNPVAIRYVLAAATVAGYETELTQQLGAYTVVATLRGSDLIGRRYAPLFDYFSHRTEAFRVLGADFVDTAEGTGIVHMAPGFGEDDQLVAEANGIEIDDAVPVDGRGCFTDAVPPWAGQNVFEANADIIATLKQSGRVLRHATYEHNYPHCWRTDTPIIYKAISSWFVKVTAIRDRLGELNQQINWVPDHVRDGRFGQWLAGARDWSISRNRFWGSPLPVWVSDDPNHPRTDVYGSLDEIEADFGIRPTDLHRPFIDELTRPNPDDPSGKATMRRVPEVLDCWFESGSMPFAQVHYPFENKEWFEQNFPADFIVEYINQSRGWFYTLHVLAGALFDQPAFENVICHGILLAADGNKLSKRLRNYTEPTDVFDNQGADALRWYLMSTNIVRGGDTRISDTRLDEVTRQVLIPIWNAYSFFTLYANADGYHAKVIDPADPPNHVLDRYLLAKTRVTLEEVTAQLDAYDLPGAAAELQAYIGALNNWYIRRSRDRFWGTAQADTAEASPAIGQTLGDPQAFDTLYTALCIFTRLAAPLLPMIMEEIHTGLTGGPSVHLTDWPDPESLPTDAGLVRYMEIVRELASTGLRLREDAGLRVRLPLSRLTVAGPGAADLAPLAGLLTDELNVREIDLTETFAGHATKNLRLNASLIGPRLGDDAQAVFAAARRGDWQLNDDRLTVAGHELLGDEYALVLHPTDSTTSAVLNDSDLVAVLDTNVTPELEAEGLARDAIRLIQQARKDTGLEVTDRIALTLRWSPPEVERVRSHEALIAANVLATELTWLTGSEELAFEIKRVEPAL